VTKASVSKILENAEDIQELSLDASPHSVRHQYCNRATLIWQNLLDLSRLPDLSNLHTLSLAFTCPAKESLGLEDLPTLPTLPNLDSLHFTLSGEKRLFPPEALGKLRSEIFITSLKRLSLLNLVISTSQLEEIITSCPLLKELYISINGRQTLLDCHALERCGLEILHVNAPDRWGLTGDDLVRLAEGMVGLDQIGTGNRVYEVFRNLDEEGEKIVELGRWSRTTIPAYFQVWRG
jgi:hypothetical protein